MNVVIQKIDNWQIKMIVDVNEQQWLQAQEKIKKKFFENVEVDGFRKGHVPENIAIKHINLNKVFDEAINLILPSVFDEAVVSNNVNPLTKPEINIEKFSTTSLTINFIVNVVPKIEINNYKNLDIKREIIEVSNDEIEESIQKLLQQHSKLEVKNGKAEKGDTVVLDFEGFIDKKPFEGGKANNYNLSLGSSQFIPGFEEKLVGVQANEKKDIEVIFPENYIADFKGKKAIFKCFIHEVKQKILPELNDENVKKILKIPNVETVADLKKYQKDLITKNKKDKSENDFYKNLLENIIKNNSSKIEVKEGIIDKRANLLKEDFVFSIKQNGMELNQYLSIIGKSEQDIMQDFKNDAKKHIYEMIVMDSILEQEKVPFSDEEIKKECDYIASTYNVAKDKISKILVVNKIKNNKFRKLIFDLNKSK